MLCTVCDINKNYELQKKKKQSTNYSMGDNRAGEQWCGGQSRNARSFERENFFNEYFSDP